MDRRLKNSQMPSNEPLTPPPPPRPARAAPPASTSRTTPPRPQIIRFIIEDTSNIIIFCIHYCSIWAFMFEIHNF